MLVIRRRPGEIVVIGEDVEVEVLEISGNQVKVGIRAPREILVLRKEVQLTRTENRAASQPPPARRLESVLDRLRGLPK
jgi:carbon storage regulator